MTGLIRPFAARRLEDIIHSGGVLQDASMGGAGSSTSPFGSNGGVSKGSDASSAEVQRETSGANMNEDD